MDLRVLQDNPPLTQQLQIDVLSQYYGSLDGYTFCGSSYDLVVEVVGAPGEPLPLWTSLVGNLFTVRSPTVLYQAQSATFVVKAIKDGVVQTERELLAEVTCDSDDLCDPNRDDG